VFESDGRLPDALAGLDRLPVGPELVARLAAVDIADLDVAGLLTALSGWGRVQSAAAGQVAALTAKLAALEGSGDPPLSSWQLADELSAAAGVSPGSAGFRMARAELWARRMPELLGLLRAGALGVGHLYAVADSLDRLADDDWCRRVDAELARLVGDGSAADRPTPGELAGRADRLVARAVAADPKSAKPTREPADPERLCRLSKRSRSLYARFSAEEYLAVAALIEESGRRGIDTVCGAVPYGPGSPTDGAAAGSAADVDAARIAAVDAEGLVYLPPNGDGEAIAAAAEVRQVNALVDLLLGRPPAAGRPQPSVGVLASASALTGGSEPATLSDGSVVPAETARRLACDGSLYRLLVDPESGRLLDAGRTRREPSARLRAFVIARDGYCRFPGCPRPAGDCEVHHFPAWADGGATDRGRLLCLCRRHHVAVHEGGWSVAGDPEGTLIFTSPAGQLRTSRAQNLARRYALGDWGVTAMSELAAVQPADPTGELIWQITEPEPRAEPPPELLAAGDARVPVSA
jgi:hypothetical protein